ncbi:MAG: BatA domain-containing protein [Candidatus Nanohaloarchaea archaeon]
MATGMLSNFFAAPDGLVALASLVPLLLFYFMKPEPEQQVMPSMAFFMENKKSGRMEQAISRLRRNLLLLLHILIVIGMAAAIAQPLAKGETKSERAVVVVDVSASMQDDFGSAKSFATSELGKKNTVIISGEQTEVKMTGASPSRVRLFMSGLTPKDVETDVVSGLETAQSYQGKIIVASDLAQTSGTGSPEETIESLQKSRDVAVYSGSQDNNWGIVGLDPGRNSTAEIANFMEKSAEITVNTPQGQEKIGVDAGETRELSFSADTGTNTISLPADGLSADNKAYVSIPQNQTVDITMIADEENPYFREAAKAIRFANYEYISPPVRKELDADIYVVGKTDRILKSTAGNIEEQTRNGDSMIIFGQPGLSRKGFNSMPSLGDEKNASVDITEPRRIGVGETDVRSVSGFGGTSWSQPESAIMHKELGSGEVLLYNIDDADFRHKFLYPVFWRDAFRELVDRKSTDQLNIETGNTIGNIRINSAGFHNVSGHVYAANLESYDESSSEPKQVESETDKDSQETKKPVQNIAAVLLALLSVGELAYLRWLGEV